jgi:hypothetical protein
MNEYYKQFDFSYDKEELLKLFNTVNKVQQGPFLHADTSVLLENDLVKQTISNLNLISNITPDQYGLSSLSQGTCYHTNPGNNGLVILPVDGVVCFDFKLGGTVKVTCPTITNGKQLHKYYPENGTATFFALKIPASISWDNVLQWLTTITSQN